MKIRHRVRLSEHCSLGRASTKRVWSRSAAQGWLNRPEARQTHSRRPPTFYRYRREFLKHGIDIAIRQPSKPDNVIPLIRVLRPEAIAQVPDWAIGTPLYFDPRSNQA